MRRFGILVVLAGCLAGVLAIGCSRERERPERPAEAVDQHSMSRPIPLALNNPDANLPAVPVPVLTPQEQYDAALLNALNLAADRKYTDALAALQQAQAVQDTAEIRTQIERMKARIDQQTAAEHTVQDVQTVLHDGKPEEAVQLATTALQQFGDGAAAAQLTDAQRQAEVLAAPAADPNAQFTHFQVEAEAAYRDHNLRAAAVAWEQAVACRADAGLQQRLDEIHATLARYDDNLRRAAELRRDPANLEDALAALQVAQQAWDTAEVRDQIADYTLALQKRRDRLSVADFELLADVGLPAAGRIVAESILPTFKCRYDLVEREQIGKVLGELNLEAGSLASSDAARQDVGRLARVRYLVVGSISPLNGVTVSARLVDVRSGLVVQTARVSAPTPDGVVSLLPQLANMLMMTDEQKMAYEQQLAARQAQVVVQPVAADMNTPLPPPPEVVPASQPVPPPIVAFAVQPPGFTAVTVADFAAVVAPPVLTVQVVHEEPCRPRLFHLLVELGDNLFRRHRYHEAQAQFQLALNVNPGCADIQVRVNRCAAIAPPPPVVAAPAQVVVAAAPLPPRPRIAIMNFVVNADPGLVPIGFGDWAADQMGSYFAGQYDIADRGQVCWYMGRLGITMRDLLVNASARLWLGRALGVRFFVFGAVQQTHSFTVDTHMIDAETGAHRGMGSIHVQDPKEFKLRVGELAGQTKADPAQLAKLKKDAQDSERLVNDARQLLKSGQAERAATVCQAGLKQHPGHVGLQTLLNQAETQVRAEQLAEARAQEIRQLQMKQAAAQKRQQELVKAAAAARARVAREAASRGEAERHAQEQRRQQAAAQLLAQGQRALQQGRADQASKLLASAVALQPTEAARQELARAKAAAEQSARQQKALAEARQRAELQRQEQARLAQAKAAVEAERRRKEAEAKAQASRDQTQANLLLREGKRLLAARDYGAAITSLQGADRLHSTEETRALIQDVLQRQSQASAAHSVKPTPNVDQQAAHVAAAEKARQEQARRNAEMARQRAEAVKKQRSDYGAAMQAGRLALKGHRYDDAIRSFTQAAKIIPGDAAAMAAVHEAQKQRDDVSRQQQDASRLAAFQRLMAQGRTARQAGRYAEAIQAFSDALKLRPGDRAASQSLLEAQQAFDRSRTPAPTQTPRPAPAPKANQTPPRPTPPPAPAVNMAEYNRQMQLGRQYDKQQQPVDALRAYREALRLKPKDAAATAGLQRATFTWYMVEGRKLSAARKYADAARYYETALKVLPNNPEATAALKRARENRP